MKTRHSAIKKNVHNTKITHSSKTQKRRLIGLGITPWVSDEELYWIFMCTSNINQRYPLAWRIWGFGAANIKYVQPMLRFGATGLDFGR